MTVYQAFKYYYCKNIGICFFIFHAKIFDFFYFSHLFTMTKKWSIIFLFVTIKIEISYETTSALSRSKILRTSKHIFLLIESRTLCCLFIILIFFRFTIKFLNSILCDKGLKHFWNIFLMSYLNKVLNEFFKLTLSRFSLYLLN